VARRILAAVLWVMPAALAVVLAAPAVALAAPTVTNTTASRFTIPATADQLIVVSSPTADPSAPGYLATLRAYVRPDGSAPWRRVFGPWEAETGEGHLVPASARHEGDHATPTGVFGIGTTMYGNQPDPGGLHYAYHRLVCGDWWDEDPYSSTYNRFVHVACGATPGFAGWSEALWTETVAYPYLAVIRFNVRPVRAGPHAPGSGIFLHSWVGGPTAGCVALRENELLELLRWLKRSAHPVIEIGTSREVSPAAPG
jgi:L,D-peptidoglycan transpeptidase YkuD (ErfK/YbiS/YcfS/YnhG family)